MPEIFGRNRNEVLVKADSNFMDNNEFLNTLSLFAFNIYLLEKLTRKFCEA